jgi:hypothetical protein
LQLNGEGEAGFKTLNELRKKNGASPDHFSRSPTALPSENSSVCSGKSFT